MSQRSITSHSEKYGRLAGGAGMFAASLVATKPTHDPCCLLDFSAAARRDARSGISRKAAVAVAAVVVGLCSAGCPVFGDADGGADPERGLMELVEAQTTHASAPRFVTADEPLRLTARGVHPDPCTELERFESTRWTRGTDVELSVWSVRPVGGCSGDASSWEATCSLSGLPHGERFVRVGDKQRRRATFLSAQPSLCGEPEPIEIRELRLPPAPHSLGSAEIVAEVVHPSPCHGPPTLRHETAQGEVRLFAEARPCGPVEDLVSCPAWNLTKPVSLDVGPLEPGEWRVVFEDQERVLHVAETSECSVQRMLVDSAHLPKLVHGDEPLVVSVLGRLPSACAAVDATGFSVSGDELEIHVDVRDCLGSCEDWLEPEEVELEVELQGVPAGRYDVRVGNLALERPVFVAPAGACSYQPLPSEAISAVLPTSGLYTDLLQESASERDAVDVHVVGRLPDGCWYLPRLEPVPGSEREHALDLRTRALWCDLGCEQSEDGEPQDPSFWVGNGGDGEEDPVMSSVGGPRAYSAGWSSPAGLSAGSYDLFVDGEKRGSVSIE